MIPTQQFLVIRVPQDCTDLAPVIDKNANPLHATMTILVEATRRTDTIGKRRLFCLLAGLHDTEIHEWPHPWRTMPPIPEKSW